MALVNAAKRKAGWPPSWLTPWAIPAVERGLPGLHLVAHLFARRGVGHDQGTERLRHEGPPWDGRVSRRPKQETGS